MIQFLFYGQDGQRSVLESAYTNPEKSLRLDAEIAYPDKEQILTALQTIDQWKEDFHVICIFSYEMGCIIQDAPMPGELPAGYPVLAAYAFSGIVEGPEEPMGGAAENPATRERGTLPAHKSGFDLGALRMDLHPQSYRRHIESIQEKIRQGRSYQVNFTTPLRMPFSGDPLQLFHSMRQRFPSPYSVYADLGDRQIVSISPELFFQASRTERFQPRHNQEDARKHLKPIPRAEQPDDTHPGSTTSHRMHEPSYMDSDSTEEVHPSGSEKQATGSKAFSNGYRLEVRPMKGTVRASKDPQQDRKLKNVLMESVKARAELAMITDLLRNDLGRIAPTGGVGLEKAIQCESYVYVHQLTSVISAFHKSGKLSDILPSLFPSGSITGAPRRETMRIIAEEENRYRGVYTGSIGLAKKDHSRLNVAIRTAEISQGWLRYGAGGGITLLSDSQKEWDELHWKARPLSRERPGLIETMLLINGRIRNRELHLERMLRSISRLGMEAQTAINQSRSLLNSLLDGIVAETPKGRYRLRIHRNSEGTLSQSVQSLDPPRRSAGESRSRWKVRLWDYPMSSHDRMLHHKVDRRGCYDSALRQARADGYDEILFYNERGEITEGSITNLFYRMEGKWYTPPIRCGLLPGIGRKRLLHRWRHRIGFRRLLIDEMESIERLVLVNSLRGLIEAKF